MSFDELIDDLRSLPPAKLAEVIDFVGRLRGRDDDDETDVALDAIAADPERLARFRAAIDVGLEQAERGEGQPASDVFADLASRYRQRHEGGEASDALWERVLRDPAATARLEGMIQVGRDSIERAGTVDGPTAIAALRAKHRLDEAKG